MRSYYNLQIYLAILRLVLGAIGEFLFHARKWEMPKFTYVHTTENASIHKALETHVGRYLPSLWAPGPCGQTLFGFLVRPGRKVPYTRREAVTLSDGVEVYLDWKERGDMPADTPIVAVCHGVSGNSDSSFPVNVTTAMLARGLRSVAVNRRGHHGAPIAGGKGYPVHADCEDMHEIAMHLRWRYPNASLILAGTSGGGNVIVRYLGQYAGKHPFSAAFVSSGAYDIERELHLYKRNWLASRLLTACMLDMLKEREKCMPKLLGDHGLESAVNVQDMYKHVNIWELEEQLVLPFYPEKYKSIDEYYRKSGCYEELHKVDIPMLLLNSRDDNLVPCELIDYATGAAQSNSKLISVVTEQGGHSAWLSGLKLDSWEIKLLLAYINQVIANTA